MDGGGGANEPLIDNQLCLGGRSQSWARFEGAPGGELLKPG